MNNFPNILDTPGDGVSFVGSVTADSQTLNDSVWTTLNLATKSFDTGNFINTSTNKFLPTTAGYYFLSLNFGVTPSTTTSFAACRLNLNNGTLIGLNLDRSPVTSDTLFAFCSGMAYFNGVDDYLEPQGIVQIGGNTIAASTIFNYSYLTS